MEIEEEKKRPWLELQVGQVNSLATKPVYMYTVLSMRHKNKVAMKKDKIVMPGFLHKIISFVRLERCIFDKHIFRHFIQINEE